MLKGLANDATSLVLYKIRRFGGKCWRVLPWSCGRRVCAIAIGEPLWGICIGWVMLRLHARARDTYVETLLSVLTPYAAYWPPFQLGGSGVLAAVSVGLYI